MKPELTKVLVRPDMDFIPAIKVFKDTKFEYKNDNVEQTLENLVFKSKTVVKGEDYESEYHTRINLKEGDYLVFEADKRGYIKPVEKVLEVDEIIKELEDLREA